MDFRLPDLGEGIDSATVVGVRVKPGDAVTKDQDVMEVETDKASVPVPVDSDGTVEKVHVKQGDKVSVGTVLLTISGGPAEPAKNGEQKPAAEKKSEPKAETQSHPAESAPAGGGQVEFKLPDLGEGIDSATVVAVNIKAGDTVAKDQDIIDVETDKASVPVPIDVAGTVDEVRVKQGDKIGVGTVIAVVTSSGGSPKPGASQTARSRRNPHLRPYRDRKKRSRSRPGRPPPRPNRPTACRTRTAPPRSSPPARRPAASPANSGSHSPR